MAKDKSIGKEKGRKYDFGFQSRSHKEMAFIERRICIFLGNYEEFPEMASIYSNKTVTSFLNNPWLSFHRSSMDSPSEI